MVKQIRTMNSDPNVTGSLKTNFMFAFGSQQFAETAANKERRTKLLEALQKFTQIAQTALTSCTFLGIGPVPAETIRDQATVVLERVVTKRLATTGWIMCINGKALHQVRGEKVIRNLGWLNCYTYSCHRKIIKQNVAPTMDFLCCALDLAVRFGRNHPFAKAQANLENGNKLRTVKANEFGVQVAPDRWSESIFQTQTHVTWRGSEQVRSTAMQTINMMSHAAYNKVRIADITFRTGEQYDDKGPAGEPIKKCYLGAFFAGTNEAG